jgi:hypothetical protein
VLDRGGLSSGTGNLGQGRRPLLTVIATALEMAASTTSLANYIANARRRR